MIAGVLLAGLLFHWVFKPNERKLFPAWATIEIALTNFIIGKGGLSRRI